MDMATVSIKDMRCFTWVSRDEGVPSSKQKGVFRWKCAVEQTTKNGSSK